MGLDPINPRIVASAASLFLFVGLLLVCRWLSPRCRRPGVLWGVGIYFMSLLAVFIYGFATSTHFETALGQLTMLSFPFSILTDHTLEQEGFGTLGEIARNFVRYVLVYGGLDGLILTGFFWVVFPVRESRVLPLRR